MSGDPYASARETELRARIEGLQQACTEAGRRLGASEEQCDKLRAELGETKARLEVARERRTDNFRLFEEEQRVHAETRRQLAILSGLRDAIEERGYTLCTPAERKVLDAMKNAEIERVGGRNRSQLQFMFELQEDAACRAELALRGLG